MPTPREQLAEILKQSRLEAGFESHGSLAKRLNVSRPVVSKAENPAQPCPSDAILAAWAGATGIGLDKLNELAERARSGIPDWFVPWRSAESGATLLRYWQPWVVPGIAQTAAYMLALFADEGHDLAKAEELATARTERQQVIGHVPVTLIIGYHVLYRVVGSPAVMSEQCGHLATLADRSMVTLHVLPEGTTTGGSGGGLDLATGGGITTVNMTTTLEDVTTTADHLVVKAQQMFDRLLGEAMPRTESLTRIRTAEGQWKAQS
jgi:transcriptional regulator with XRE-family HTH domain